MGNSKLPSSASCHACRPRRAKCDRARPGCTQCARKLIICPGYLDLSDLRIRDETKAVVRKAQKSTPPLQGPVQGAPPSQSAVELEFTPSSFLEASVATIEEPGDQITESSICRDHGAITRRLHGDVELSKPVRYCSVSSPIEDIAVSLFLGDYAPVSRLSSVLSPLLFYISSPALEALRATSLAYLFITAPPSSSLSHSTFATYGIALSHTHASLADPTSAVTDMTLLAVLLLALFECLTLRGHSSRTAWLAHNEGVSALLRLRRRQRREGNPSQVQVLDRLAARQVRIAGVLRAGPTQVQKEVCQMEKGETAAEQRVNRLLDHITRLKLSAHSPDSVSTGGSLEIARLTRELDTDIALWSASPLPRAGPGPAYAHAAVSWLTTRIIRLFLNHTLQSQTLHIKDSEALTKALAIRDDARENNRRIAAEIIAMVSDLVSTAREGVNLAVVARYLIWPLALFANSDDCPPPGRVLVLEQLKEVTQRWNLVPHEEALKLLEGSTHSRDWYGHHSENFRF